MFIMALAVRTARCQKAGAIAFGFFLAAELAFAEARIGFERSEYVTLVGAPLEMSVVFDVPFVEGIVSYGILLRYNPDAATLNSDGGIWIPPELDFNGVMGAGAIRHVEPGSAGVKGTTDFYDETIVSYKKHLLAVFELAFAEPGIYEVSVEPFRTLGPNEQIFVSALGAVLDDQIRFDVASVNVIPEPRVWQLLGLGWGLLLAWVRLVNRPKVLV